MISMKTILFPSFLLCISICFHVANSQLTCSGNISSTGGRAPYRDNVQALLSTLYANSTTPSGFYNSTVGTGNLTVYGLFLCKGDVSPNDCQTCLKTATAEVLEVQLMCDPNATRANIFYDDCMLRYSDKPIFSKLDLHDPLTDFRTENYSDPALLNQVLSDTFDAIATKAANGTDFPGKKFAVQYASLVDFQKIYALAQCTPDLSNLDCTTCLREAIPKLPVNKVRAGVTYPSCKILYETYSVSNVPDPAPSPTIAPPPPPGPDTGSKQEAHSKDSKISVAIALSIVSCIVLFTLGFIYQRRRSRNTHYSSKRHDESDEDDIITVDPESLQYSLSEIETATNGFSLNNKIGQGGFGSVYMGILPNGLEIAVKRLSKSSGQGAAEFKNEIAVVAKLQHRNLVQLLGYCLEGKEKILVYEFVPRRSLDYFLFDPEKKGLLNWSRRHNIIRGIARGLVYLHEDSRLKIVHRDLKAGNILLDEIMHPKIADFGMAKICEIHDSEGNTNRIAGTFGYMAPEYTRSGQYSVKSDVFSFGVVLLEIITGKKNSSFYQSEVSEDLISYAWRQWTDGTPLLLLDPAIGDSYVPAEVTQCVHISLLCVEEDANKRPTMASIVSMLNSASISLPIPHHPAILKDDRLDKLSMESKELLLDSINEVSFTEPHPR